jgi:AcrR family transcriptional regulator
MVDSSTRDRRAERREATRAEILEAAWQLVRDQGLAGLSLRDVAARIGMRPPSLYWYFDSKHAVYDAMFAEGNRALTERMIGQDWPDEPRPLLQAMARRFLEFAIEDPARAQLLFHRTIPDFEPSAESYAIAVEGLEFAKAGLAGAGVTEPAHVDLWTALLSGLASQQLANDPGGDRWLRLVDEAVDMYADHVLGEESGEVSGERPARPARRQR